MGAIFLTLPREPNKKVASQKFVGGSFKDLRGFVLHLMEKQSDQFSDRDFAERALLNLTRKISAKSSELVEWEKAIIEGDPNTGCVTVPRYFLSHS